MVVMSHRPIGVYPILINREKRNDSTDGQIIPNGCRDVIIAVQKRIDQRHDTQRRHKPIRQDDLVAPAR